MLARAFFFAVLIFFFSVNHSRSQDPAELLRYKEELKLAQTDSERVDILAHLCFHSSTTHPDSGIIYGKQGLEIAERINYLRGIGDCQNNLGWCYYNKGNYAEAKKFLNAAIETFVKTGNECYEAVPYSNLGWCYFRQGNKTEALKNFLKNYEITQRCPDKGFHSTSVYQIGVIYRSTGNIPEAKKYILEAYSMSEKNSDSLHIGHCLTSLGNISLDENKFSEAFEYYNRALEIANARNDRYQEAMNHENIGLAYQKQKQYDKAEKSFLKAVESFRIISSKNDETYELTALGQLLEEKGDHKKALAYLKLALALCDSNHFMVEKAEVLMSMSEIYRKQNSFRLAYIYYKESEEIRDSIEEASQQEKFAELQTRFETEKKDREISLLTKDNALQEAEAEKQKQLKNFFIAGGIILLLITGLLVNRYYLKRQSAKKLEEKNKIISEEKDRAEALRIRAEHGEKLRQQFLANMSHEIRTPMNAIIGMTDLALDSSPEAVLKNYLEGVKHSAENLLVIINDILDLSKIEAGKLELSRVPFDLRELVQGIHRMMKIKAGEKKLLFEYSIDEEVPQIIKGDPVRLNQVLINLLGNAVKFTEKGEVKLEIGNSKLSNEQFAGTQISNFKFQVSDSGIGIQKEKLETIFDSFTQAHATGSRKYGGTGLGLTIVKNLVGLMGGTISVTSEEGKGSVFTMTIPFEPANEKEQEAFYAAQKKKYDDGVDLSILEGKHILVAEDNPYNQTVIIDTLKKRVKGISITTVTNGRDVISKLPTTSYQLILMDIQMPEMDGYETTRYIRNNFPSPLKDIPIIAVTASVIRSDLEKCIKAGMNGYIPKPFRRNELFSAMVDVLKSGKVNTAIERKAHASGASLYRTINLSYLREFTEGDSDELMKYLMMFKEGIPVKLELIEDAYRKKDWALMSSVIHSMKPLVASAGMINCEEEITACETIIRTNQLNKLLPKIISIKKICKAALEEVQEETEAMVQREGESGKISQWSVVNGQYVTVTSNRNDKSSDSR